MSSNQKTGIAGSTPFEDGPIIPTVQSYSVEYRIPSHWTPTFPQVGPSSERRSDALASIAY